MASKKKKTAKKAEPKAKKAAKKKAVKFGSKKKKVLELLKTNPDLSNSEIAEQAGCEQSYVYSLRKAQDGTEQKQSDKAKPGRPPKASAKDAGPSSQELEQQIVINGYAAFEAGYRHAMSQVRKR